MKEKTNFLMYKNWYQQIKLLDDNEKAQLLIAIYQYQCEGIDLNTNNGKLAMLWISIKNIFDLNAQAYDDKCKKNSDNAKKRYANAYERKRTHTKPADNDIDNDNDIDIDIDIDNDIDKNKSKSKRFAPPSIEEIKKYIEEKDYNISADAFYNFYQSKNWYVGKNKMKDWRACVRSWNAREKKEQPIIDKTDATYNISEIERKAMYNDNYDI